MASTDAERPTEDTPVEAPRAERLGAFEVLLDLAAGGMATVHLARALDRREGPPLVAIKRPHRHLSADKTFLTMLVDEARLASAIAHPNVVRVRELGFEAGVPFIVMEYIEGASLAEMRRELAAAGRALDVRVAVRVVLDLLSGLAAAHELTDEAGRSLNIVHRDVSPHNVLIGSDGRARITDFGIAKAEDRIQTTRTHEVKGKLAYLAPERVDKRRLCTVQSDVFSVAVVFWECFAGRRLFRSEQMVDLLQELMSAPIPTLRAIGAQVPEALDDVIARALSRDLNERYASSRAFAAAVEGAVGREHVGTHADVARLVEAVFGARMAARQERVRAAIGGDDLAELLVQSGLRSRDVDPAGDPSASLLAELAPAAPSGRYVVGSKMLPGRSGTRRRLAIWRPALAVAGGVVAGASLAVLVLGRARSSPTGSSPAPPALIAATPQASGPPGLPPATPSAVMSVVARPPEEPPSDQRPRSAASIDPPRRSPSSRGAVPIGTVRGGFTKLR